MQTAEERKAKRKAYNATPARVAAKRASAKTALARAQQKAHRETDERKAYLKARAAKPESLEDRRARSRTPEYRAARKARDATPEAKAKTKRQDRSPKRVAAHFIRQSVKRLKNYTGRVKAGQALRAEERCGYTVVNLHRHIEMHFLDGMTWENRTAWHIDHIKPVTAFLAEGEYDPAIVNALSNLRPLWADDNIRKFNNYDPKINLPVEVCASVYA